MLEGFDFTGIERETEYAEIARARIEWWAQQPADVDLARLVAGGKDRAGTAADGQSSIFDVLGDAA